MKGLTFRREESGISTSSSPDEEGVEGTRTVPMKDITVEMGQGRKKYLEMG